jgi:hypothetical protein
MSAAPGSDLAAVRSAAGSSYTTEWSLFCDYTAATGQPTLPTTVTALTRFLAEVPARASTQARRIAAIAAAHRNTGHLPIRPEPANQSPPELAGGPTVTDLIMACPTRGWPHGFTGRRDAYLLVLVGALKLPHSQARLITPADLTTKTTGSATGAISQQWSVRGREVRVTGDPRCCPTCVLVRWLEILGIADGLGRGSARMHLSAAHATIATDPHRHAIADTPRWRACAQLLPAIDRHGWIDDFQPLSLRAIHTRLTRATTRARFARPPADRSDAPNTLATTSGNGGANHHFDNLDEVLALLDKVAADADALNAHINTLLAHNSADVRG